MQESESSVMRMITEADKWLLILLGPLAAQNKLDLKSDLSKLLLVNCKFICVYFFLALKVRL